MRFRCRRMEPRDVRDAVAYVKSQATEQTCYGLLITHLAAVWRRLLARDSLTGLVVEDTSGLNKGFRALIVGVFVSDDFVDECKIGPRFWLGPGLTHRVLRGPDPVLTPKAVRLANSGSGLNYVLWACYRPSDSESDSCTIHQMITDSFFVEHRGFQFKEILVHHSDLPGAKIALDAGMRFWDFGRQKYDTRWKRGDQDIEEFLKRPSFLGMSRTLALQHLGLQISPLFIWRRPRLGFSSAQQRLTRLAMTGLTDEELSETLKMSHSTIKNTWRSIFHRVEKQLPGLLPHPPGEKEDGVGLHRGKGKRQKLISFLSAHPEELRPFHRLFPF